MGIESTVLDLSVSPPGILRPGMIHAESIYAALENSVCGWRMADGGLNPKTNTALRSPGLLAKHYSPRARLVVWSWQNDDDLLSQIRNSKSSVRNCFVIAHTKIPAGIDVVNVSVIPHDAEAFARALYAELHRCDAAGAELIVVESPPVLPEWSGIADRLRRAAA